MNFNNIRALLKKVNLEDDIINAFIKDNVGLILTTPNIQEHLFFITKGPVVYGIVYIDGDFYKWSVLDKNGFTPFKEYTDDDKEFLSICDYIVELILRYPLKPEVRELLPGIEDLSLEDQIKKLCKTNFDSGSNNIQ